MALSDSLQSAGYDYIGGILRNQALKQVWFNPGLIGAPELISPIGRLVASNVDLVPYESVALNVEFNQSVDYGYKAGFTFLKGILDALHLGGLDIGAQIGKKSKLSVKFSDTNCTEYLGVDVRKYFETGVLTADADLVEEKLNSNKLIFISGVVSAKGLEIIFESNTEIGADAEGTLTDAAEGKLEFKKSAGKTLKLTSRPGIELPVAVKFYRLFYQDKAFQKIKLISDVISVF